MTVDDSASSVELVVVVAVAPKPGASEGSVAEVTSVWSEPVVVALSVTVVPSDSGMVSLWLEVGDVSVTTVSACVVGTETVVDASNVVGAAVVVGASVVATGKSSNGDAAVEDSVVVPGTSVTVVSPEVEGSLDAGGVVPVVGIDVVGSTLETESPIVVPSSVASVWSASVVTNEALPATGTLVVAEDSTKPGKADVTLDVDVL